MLIVQACEFMFTGDGFYRHHDPSRYLARLPGVTVIDCHATHRFLWPLAARSDVLILPVIVGWELFPLIEKRRAEGKITVLETNDYFHEMQPWNPIAPYWLDPDVQAEHIRYIQECDAVQTSTETLANHWRPHAKTVQVFKNYLSRVPELRPTPERPLTIGWAGSQGHLADWYSTTTILQPWLDAHPDVQVAVMTHSVAKEYLRLEPSRYHFREAGILDEYFEFLPELDIGFAPLLPNEYNRCRSDVKFLEYAINGIVGIYSGVGPYQDTVRHGENGYLYNKPEELLNILDELAASPKKRQRIRSSAYAEVLSNRRLEEHVQQRLSFYRSILRAPEQNVDLPQELLQAAEVDGRYVRLISGEIEAPVLRALGARATPASAQELKQLLQQFPAYLLCARTLSKQLNDLGQPPAALAVAQHCAQLAPGTAQTTSETGRACYLLGDKENALRLLKESVTQNPQHIGAWGYLLRFLAGENSPELDEYLQLAIERNPESYRLPLLVLRLSPKDQQLALLRRLMKDKLSTLSLRQLLAASVEVAAVIEQTLVQVGDESGALGILKQACELFPYSSRLGNAYAKLLHRNGKERQALKTFQRIAEFHHISTQQQAEFSLDDPQRYTWLVSETLKGK